MIFELYGYEIDENGDIIRLATEDSYAGFHNMNGEQSKVNQDQAFTNML